MQKMHWFTPKCSKKKIGDLLQLKEAKKQGSFKKPTSEEIKPSDSKKLMHLQRVEKEIA